MSDPILIALARRPCIHDYLHNLRLIPSTSEQSSLHYKDPPRAKTGTDSQTRRTSYRMELFDELELEPECDLDLRHEAYTSPTEHA